MAVGRRRRSCSTSARSRAVDRGDAARWPKAANAAGVPVVLDPVGAGATTLPHRDGATRCSTRLEIAVVRGNAAEIATLAGQRGRDPRRRVDRRGRPGRSWRGRPLGRSAACVAVTGPVDHVSDGERVHRGRQRARAARHCHGHGLHVDGDHRLLPRRARPTIRWRPPPRRWSPSAWPARTPPRGAKGPGSFHVALYDALYDLDPAEARLAGEGRRMRLHAIVERPRGRPRRGRGRRDRRAAAASRAPHREVVEAGQGFRELPATFVVNDDVEAALALGADGVHLGRDDAGRGARARGRASCSASSAAIVEEARAGRRPAPPTSAPARSGRRRRSRTPIRRSGSTGSPRSARRSRSRWSRSAASTPRTQPTASAPERPGSRSSARPRRGTCGRRSMRLSSSASSACSPSSSGGASHAGSRTTRPSSTAASSSRRTRSSRACTSGSTWTSYRELGYRAAAVNLSDLAASGAEPEALLVDARARRQRRELDDVLELYEGLNEPGVPVRRRRHDGAPRASTLAVTALGRSERVPGRGGARPGDLLVVTGPLGAAGAAFREQPSRAPAAAPRGRPPPGRATPTR